MGRERESAHLAELLEQARHGSASSLVVRGEPGVGKSALLEALVSDAGGALVLRTQGLEVESPLAFAALHRLLLPVMRLRDQLPVPQARALRVAFGEEDGPSIEPFLVAVATLSLLTAAAEESTVLCVVEDAHWLDPATADALLFCARRLGADRVLLVFSARDGAATVFRADGLGELRLAGLAPDAARMLLDRRLGAAPAPDVTERLIVETGGNPLALLELPAELDCSTARWVCPAADPAAPVRPRGAGIPRPQPRAARRRCSPCSWSRPPTTPATSRSSAVRHRPSTSTSRRSRPPSPPGCCSRTRRAVEVRHPLVRSALYQAATGQQRRRVHRALADALAALGDSDRAAWHRAAATEGPDPDVAAALELVGARAERRGAYVSALAAYERAAALTTATPQRAGLTLAAARNAWACGQTTRARALLADARRLAADPVLLGNIARLHGRIEVNLGSATDAHRIFVEAAHAVHAIDPPRALEMAAAAAVMRTYGADSGAVLEAGDLDVEIADGDPARTVCLKQMLVAMTGVSPRRLVRSHDGARRRPGIR